MTTDPALIPVIVGVGEIADRPEQPQAGIEPVELMARALLRAEADAGARLIGQIDSLDIINEISWPYADIRTLLTDRIGSQPARATYHPVGGQTPLLAIHEAALRIAAGRSTTAVICGAEAEHTVRRARKSEVELPWHPRLADFEPVRGAHYQRPIARRLEVATPAHVYPFYEAATRSAWRQSFVAAQRESAAIWANNAAIAANRAEGWLKQDIAPHDILTPSATNRLIAWPYPKLMVANPVVNQGAAVIVTSVAKARALGIPDHRLIYIWGGGAADEPRDYLSRERYDRSSAMEFALGQAIEILAAYGRNAFDHVELYSCFPVVPKMARRTLGLDANTPLTVTGGLTFFGAPLNNYMTHATVAMVQTLREGAGTGLLFGQGEYVTKHHALVLSAEPGRLGLNADYRRADMPTGDGPELDSSWEGAVEIESYTVLFDRESAPRHGVIIARNATGARVLARVPVDRCEAISFLLDPAIEPVGAYGRVRLGSDGIQEWTNG